MSNTAAPHLSADAAIFWDKLAFYIGHAFSLFGAPSALAQRIWFSRRDHKMFCDFIRPLEAMARGLIFIAALELAPMTLPPTPERKFRARRDMPANAGAPFEMDKPETWRVSFRLSAHPASAGFDKLSQAPSDSSASLSRAERVSKGARTNAGHVSSAPSAARLEALLRVIDDPDKYAAALARKLARKPAVAHRYTARPSPKLAHQTGYNTLFELIPLCAEAFHRSLHRKLDALLLNTS